MTTHLKQQGFTLIEILSVLLIISIISLIAYPNYISYIYKSNRLDAHNSLFHYQALWQQCALNVMDAQECLDNIGLDSGSAKPSLSAHYQISANIDASTVIFTAVPVQHQANDTTCALFLLDSMGHMKAYDKQQQDTTKQCW
jgi:prepilin-type N-terminal cleavage/methylation domain-containing protein